MPLVPREIMTDVEVEVPVVVEVGERGRCGPVAVATQASGVGHVLKGPVAPIAIQGIRPPSGDEEVGMPVVVKVPDGNPMAVTLRQLRDPRRGRDILECTVATIAEEPITTVGSWSGRIGRERSPLDHVDVQPAVTIVVEQSQATRIGFGKLAAVGSAVVVNEAKSRGLGVIDEVDGCRPGRHGFARSRRAKARAGTFVGDSVRQRQGGSCNWGLGPIELLEEPLRFRTTFGLPAEQDGPASGLEASAQVFGQLSELPHIRGRGFAEDEGPIARQLLVGNGLLTAEIGSEVDLSILMRQLGEPGRGVPGATRLPLNELLPGEPLGLSVAPLGGEPRLQLREFGGFGSDQGAARQAP